MITATHNSGKQQNNRIFYGLKSLNDPQLWLLFVIAIMKLLYIKYVILEIN